MEMNIREDKRIVEIWLTNAESRNAALRESLKGLYADYRARKYTVAVFTAGQRNLYENTRDLLLFNRRRSAERLVQQQKRMAMEQ